ncbi:uncharacterized protein KZ484_018101 [Pholidichthys leucotaenia]
MSCGDVEANQRLKLLAEFPCLPLLGLESCFGLLQLLQLPADQGHVELGGLALLPQGGRLQPQLCGGHRELLTALAAHCLHPLGVFEEGLHAHHHRVILVTRHVLWRREGKSEVKDLIGGWQPAYRCITATFDSRSLSSLHVKVSLSKTTPGNSRCSDIPDIS